MGAVPALPGTQPCSRMSPRERTQGQSSSVPMPAAARAAGTISGPLLRAGRWLKGSSAPTVPTATCQAQPRFSARAGSLLLRLDPKWAGGYSPQGKEQVKRLEPVGAPGYPNRHVGTVTAKKASAGSEGDLLVMLIISSHHLPACSSFPWCFPLPPPSWSVASRLSQTLCPRTSPAHPSSSFRSAPLPEPFLPSLPPPNGVSPEPAFPLPLPIHSLLLGWFLRGRASPFAPGLCFPLLAPC